MDTFISCFNFQCIPKRENFFVWSETTRHINCLKYFQSIYSASTQKYSIRRDKDANIYLIKRPALPKELKGKKTRESVSDILNDKDFKKDYLIKLTPPEYLNVKDELKAITQQLNILSGDIKILQADLIELGPDISKDDIKKFEKIIK